MREIAINFLIGAIGLEFGVLYCMLKQEFRNKMKEENKED